MFDKLDEIVSRFEELEARLAAPGLYDDPDAAAKLLRERSELEPVVLVYRSLQKARDAREEAEAMLSDPELRELAQEEWAAARARIG